MIFKYFSVKSPITKIIEDNISEGIFILYYYSLCIRISKIKKL